MSRLLLSSILCIPQAAYAAVLTPSQLVAQLYGAWADAAGAFVTLAPLEDLLQRSRYGSSGVYFARACCRPEALNRLLLHEGAPASFPPAGPAAKPTFPDLTWTVETHAIQVSVTLVAVRCGSGSSFFYVQGLGFLFLPLRELEALPAETRGPLHGVPFGVKDNIDVAGFPTTAACEAFRHLPAATAPVVDQLLAAGADGNSNTCLTLACFVHKPKSLKL